MLRTIRSFTLVEIVMVIVIIGLLASVIVPKFTTQREQAAVAATKANLENLRTAVSLYYAQEGQWPLADLSDLWDGTSPSGTVYIQAIPNCMTYDPTMTPVLPSNAVADLPSPNGTGGWYWIYTAKNYVLHPNLNGSDANGMAFAEY